MAIALLFAGCVNADEAVGQAMTIEFKGVVVTAEVPSRITNPDTGLVTFSVENPSTDQVQVWVEVAVDGLDPGCEIANAQNWSDVEAQANDAESDRFPLYRLRPGETLKGASSTVVSPDCLGGSLEVVILVGSADPSGDYETGRLTVEVG